MCLLLGELAFPKVATKETGQYLNLRIPDTGTGWKDSSARPSRKEMAAVKRSKGFATCYNEGGLAKGKEEKMVQAETKSPKEEMY